MLKYIDQEPLSTLAPATEPIDLPEVQYEDEAGLKPLPINRMRQQAVKRRNEGARKFADKIESTIKNSDPQESEWRQRENNWREQPRSRSVDRGRPQDWDQSFNDLISQGIKDKEAAFERTRDRSLDNRSGVDQERFKAEQQEQRDLQSMRMSTFLKDTNPLYEKLRQGLFNSLDERLRNMQQFDSEAGVDSIKMQNMPASLLSTPEGREVANDLLAEWRSTRSSANLPAVSDVLVDLETIPTPSNPEGVRYFEGV